MVELSGEAQQLLAQFQQAQQHLQTVLMQEETISLQKLEIGRALEELEKKKEEEKKHDNNNKEEEGEDFFKVVGPILVKSTREKLINELGERKDKTELRLKTLKGQEEQLKSSLSATQAKLQAILPKNI